MPDADLSPWAMAVNRADKGLWSPRVSILIEIEIIHARQTQRAGSMMKEMKQAGEAGKRAGDVSRGIRADPLPQELTGS